MYAKRIVEVRDGRIVRDEPVKNRRTRRATICDTTLDERSAA